jgi:hypothetical protein
MSPRANFLDVEVTGLLEQLTVIAPGFEVPGGHVREALASTWTVRGATPPDVRVASRELNAATAELRTAVTAYASRKWSGRR